MDSVLKGDYLSEIQSCVNNTQNITEQIDNMAMFLDEGTITGFIGGYVTASNLFILLP